MRLSARGFSGRATSRVLSVLILAYAAVTLSRLVAPAEPVPAPSPQQTGWYGVYFTNPGGANSISLTGGPDELLAAAIDAARSTVDVAVYDLNLWSVRDVLLRAHQRGVRVRVVGESDNFDRSELLELRAAGVPVQGDERSPLMHHKFVVIDGVQLWTGSMNLTVSGAYRNNNNLIRIDSPWLADQYSGEFDEMFVEQRYGALSLPNFPLPTLTLGEARVEVRFSPDDGVADRIVQLLHGAQSSIAIMAYSLTLDSLADALLERAAAGVRVEAIFDAGQANNQGSDVDRLREAGIPVALDGIPGKMHHKVMVVDQLIVITGSYNFSRSAEERNDENVLIVFSPELAELYLAEFERLRREASY